jgi:MFS family permease
MHSDSKSTRFFPDYLFDPDSALSRCAASGLAGAGPFVCRRPSSAALLRFHLPLLELTPTRFRLGRIIIVATCAFGLRLMGFAVSRSLWFSIVMLVLTGLGMMVQMAASNTILQTIVDDDKRGRVMSFYSMAFLGIAPFGSLFAGVLARAIGAGPTVLVGGVACLLGAFVFAVRLSITSRLLNANKGFRPCRCAAAEAATEAFPRRTLGRMCFLVRVVANGVPIQSSRQSQCRKARSACGKRLRRKELGERRRTARSNVA